MKFPIKCVTRAVTCRKRQDALLGGKLYTLGEKADWGRDCSTVIPQCGEGLLATFRSPGMQLGLKVDCRPRNFRIRLQYRSLVLQQSILGIAIDPPDEFNGLHIKKGH